MHDDFDEPFDPVDSCPLGDRQEPFQSTLPPASPSNTSDIPICPKCQSTRVETRNHARKAGGAIGTVAGMTSGVAFALSGADVGVTASPVRSACGALAGAVIAGLIGGAAGCATGAVLGEVVDDKVLNNFRCNACRYSRRRRWPNRRWCRVSSAVP